MGKFRRSCPVSFKDSWPLLRLVCCCMNHQTKIGLIPHSWRFKCTLATLDMHCCQIPPSEKPLLKDMVSPESFFRDDVQDRVSLCDSGCIGTCSVNEVGFELRSSFLVTDFCHFLSSLAFSSQDGLSPIMKIATLKSSSTSSSFSYFAF